MLAGKLEYLEKLKKINRKAFRDQKKKRFAEKGLYYEASSSSDEEAEYDNWGQKIINPDKAYKRDCMNSEHSNDSDELEVTRKVWDHKK